MSDLYPNEKETVETILTQSERFSPNIVHIHHIEGNEGDFRDFPNDLHPDITRILRSRGIQRLYSHQAEAWEQTASGQNITVVTPTASGKTLTYNLPVLQKIIENPKAKALYLFPTKALSQDQMTELHELITALERDIKVYTFDGDTPSSARAAIRKQGNIVVTNPDMLHQGILPHHTKWMQFFQNLDVVVIDEMHIYRGVFGSHMTNVIRRLKRICRFYRSNPLFILCSATIANPGEHASRLIEDKITVIDRSGAPVSPKTLIFYNPPIINKELGIRASYIKQARYLAEFLIQNNVQTLIFALSRLNVEVLTKYLKDTFDSERESMSRPEIIAGYRGGYLPNRRREIEKGIRSGQIRGVVSTNALELGIDIGSLDATILAGYPGSISSTWQQIGRAGRRGKSAIGIFIGRSDPLDQFLMQNPGYFFGQSPEHARMNPDNIMLLVDHIKCAAFELPFQEGDTFGNVPANDLKAILEFLTNGGVLHYDNHRWYWSDTAYPAVNVNLRRSPEGNFVVVDTENNHKIIGEVDYSAAILTIYPDAIYLASGQQYIVDTLDWDGRKALVRPTDSDYYTDSIDYTKVKVLSEDEKRHTRNAEVFQGEVQVMTRAVGFKKIRFYTSENTGYGKINLPDLEMATTAYWFTIPNHVIEQLPRSRADIVDGLLGISKALHSVATLHIMSEPHDIHKAVGDKSSEWFAMNTITERGIYSAPDEDKKSVKLNPEDLENFQPTLFIYDNYPGGIGFSPLLYDAHEKLIRETGSLIKNCSCPNGCPSCVGPSNEVGINTKEIALDILSLLMEQES